MLFQNQFAADQSSYSEEEIGFGRFSSFQTSISQCHETILIKSCSAAEICIIFQSVYNQIKQKPPRHTYTMYESAM